MWKKLCCYCWLLFCQLLLAALVCSKDRVIACRFFRNPANDLVNMINDNQTAHKLGKLNNSPGLGRMALQFVEFCKSNCTIDNTVNCKPSEDDFTEIFGPNCGIELPSFGTITGCIVGCRSNYLEPSLAFSNILVRDKNALSILSDKSHSEVGVGMVEAHKGPVFWCVLFSSGQTNSTFLLENHGLGIKQKKGCYSGSSIPCSVGQKSAVFPSKFLIFSFVVYQSQQLYSILFFFPV